MNSHLLDPKLLSGNQLNPKHMQSPIPPDNPQALAVNMHSSVIQSPPCFTSALSSSPLPSMKTMNGEFNHREEDYIGSHYHNFTEQDSKCYQLQDNEFDFLTSALLREQLRVGTALGGVISGRIRDLIECIIEFSENVTYWRDGTINEALTGLRYWKVNTDGTRSLFKEWAELFSKTDYLELSPPEVQDFFNGLPDYQKPEATGIYDRPTQNPYGSRISHRNPAMSHKNGIPLTVDSDWPPPARFLGERKTRGSDREEDTSNDGNHTKQQAVRSPPSYSAPTIRRSVFHHSSGSTAATTTQSATVRQVPAVVLNQPILHPASVVSTYAPMITLNATGIERYPWTQVRQLMWFRKHNKTLADLPAEAFRTTYNPAHTGTPENSNLRLLGRMHVTICELLTYFPLSTTIREVAYRLDGARWTAADIIKYILWTRCITDSRAIKRSKIHRMLDSGRQWAVGRTVTATAELGGLDTASGLSGYGADLIDFPLFHLSDNVFNHPTGQDAGLLAQCIARCRVTEDRNTTMAGAEAYATRHGIRDHYAHLRNSDVRIEDHTALGRVGETATTWFRAAGLRL
jgi:hypothetical protein